MADKPLAENVIVEEQEVFDLLQSLSEKSLVNTQTSHNELRFYMLESVSYYSSSKAKQVNSTDDSNNTNKYIEYYYREADNFNSLTNSKHPSDVIKAFNMLDGKNTENALTYCKLLGNYEVGLKLTNNLINYWIHTSKYSIGINWQDYFNECNKDNVCVYLGRGYHNMGILFGFVNYNKRTEYCRKSVDIFNSTDDKRWQSIALSGLSLYLADERNVDEALKHVTKAIDIIESCKYNDLKGFVYRTKSFLHYLPNKTHHDLGKANEYLNKSISFLDDPSYLNQITLYFLVAMMVYDLHHDFPKSEYYLKMSVDKAERIDFNSLEIIPIFLLCASLYEQGKYDECEYYCNKYIPLSKSMNMMIHTGMLLKMLSLILGTKKEIHQSIQVFNDSCEYIRSKTTIRHYLNSYQILLKIFCLNKLYKPYIVVAFARDKLLFELVPNAQKEERITENDFECSASLKIIKQEISEETYLKYQRIGEEMTLEDLENYCRKLENQSNEYDKLNYDLKEI